MGVFIQIFYIDVYSVIMRKYCRLYCLINIRACMPPVLQKNEKRSVGLTMRWPARVKSGDLQRANPENSKCDAVDVAPSVPAQEGEPAAEPSPENKAAAEPTTVTAEPVTAEPATAEPTTAEPATAEPARRGPVDQELDLTLDNPTDRALFQLGRLPTKLRTAIVLHGPCRPKGQFAIRGENGNIRIFYERHYHAHSGGNGNRTAMALLLTNDEETILSKLLVVR